MGHPYAYVVHPAPPWPPELPEGVDPYPRWPAWYAPVGFITALFATIVVSGIMGAIAAAAGADLDKDVPALTIAATLVQGVIFIATAVLFAALTKRPKPWHFGLRRSRFWPSFGWAALGMFCFYVFAIAYSVIIQAEGDQDVVESLGADESTLAFVLGAIVVIVVAPVAEEFFFRGFFYRALRSRLGIWSAAAVDGLLFGAIHFTGGDTLPFLPILAVLGFIFCLVYERTGTLYAVIGLHALNNTIAYSAQADGSVAISLSIGAAMLAVCMLAPRFGAPRTPAFGRH